MTRLPGHQTVSLTARHLEAAGMPTVILGSALDVVEHCGVPRFLFTDFPLGNPCGKPFDTAMQEAIVVQEEEHRPARTCRAGRDHGAHAVSVERRRILARPLHGSAAGGSGRTRPAG